MLPAQILTFRLWRACWLSTINHALVSVFSWCRQILRWAALLLFHRSGQRWIEPEPWQSSCDPCVRSISSTSQVAWRGYEDPMDWAWRRRVIPQVVTVCWSIRPGHIHILILCLCDVRSTTVGKYGLHVALFRTLLTLPADSAFWELRYDCLGGIFSRDGSLNLCRWKNSVDLVASISGPQLGV